MRINPQTPKTPLKETHLLGGCPTFPRPWPIRASRSEVQKLQEVRIPPSTHVRNVHPTSSCRKHPRRLHSRVLLHQCINLHRNVDSLARLGATENHRRCTGPLLQISRCSGPSSLKYGIQSQLHFHPTVVSPPPASPSVQKIPQFNFKDPCTSKQPSYPAGPDVFRCRYANS